jgi:hypothetical protein
MEAFHFIELKPFSSKREEHLDDDEFNQLQAMLNADPERGDVMQGTGGVRKVRVASKGRNAGKSGGARIIYYHVSHSSRVYLITIIDKTQKENLNQSEKNELKKLTQALN